MQIQPEKPEPEQTPMASAKGDLRQLRQNTGATVTELKAFLKELKGKSPQEMLGIVAGSQLLRAIGMSCILVAGGIVIFTAIPYAMGGREKTNPAAKKEAAAAKAPQPGATPAPTPAPAPAPAPNPDQATPSGADLSKLGVNEEKKAPPNKNPLENKKDNFLDGLD